MECPLSTWPSITQYDGFYCTGLGDIDPLESLDRSFDNNPGTSLSDSQESKASPPSANTAPDMDTSAQISNAQGGGNLYRLRSSDSLAAARWDSINAVDLDSVLDSALPSQDASTTSSGENMYDLYSDGILNDVNEFMSGSLSKGADGRGGFLPCESLQMNASSTTPDMVFSEQLHDIQTNRVVQWPNMASPCAHSQVFDGEVHHSPLHVRENYPAIMEQQVRLADAARVELERNRAQASRARRLAASQRRTKKYLCQKHQQRTKKDLFQKHIRMSSSSTGARDRLDRKLAGTSAMPHPPLQMVPQGHFAAGIQSLPRTILNSQVPGFVPVLQSPQLASGHGKLPQARAGPNYCYRQQTSVAPLEDSCVQSGRGAVQSITDQDVQSTTSAPPSMAMSQSASSMQCLDAAVLEKLQSMLCKMKVDIRLCIRDALYDLANSSKHCQSKTDSALDSSSSHSRESMDRWIVSILFCKQPTSFFQPDPRLYAHSLTQAGGDLSFQNAPMNSSFHQWNSCGSSVNLQERPLHLLKGL